MKYPHNSFVIDGLTDRAAFAKDAEKRRDRDGETTIIHSHKEDVTCSDVCEIYEPGFKTRQMWGEKIPVN